VYPILYYFIQASTRYRSPVLWISVLPAAYAVWAAASRLAVRRLRPAHALDPACALNGR
jgi:hypothetical protein